MKIDVYMCIELGVCISDMPYKYFINPLLSGRCWRRNVTLEISKQI